MDEFYDFIKYLTLFWMNPTSLQEENADPTNTQNQPSAIELQEDEGPSELEIKYGPEEVETKGGMPVDMCSGSEEESTSGDSTDDDDSNEGRWTVRLNNKHTHTHNDYEINNEGTKNEKEVRNVL